MNNKNGHIEDEIMTAILEGNISILEEYSRTVDGFPEGKCQSEGKHWILVADILGRNDVVDWMVNENALVPISRSHSLQEYYEYEEVLDGIDNAITEGDIAALNYYSRIIKYFPKGKNDDDYFWITDAINYGSMEVIKWMIDKGVDLRFRDGEGYTVLHTTIGCCRKEHKHDLLKLLIENGADVNAYGINDWTPAHLAAVINDLQSLKILHEAGADLNLRTRIDDYATPLEEAMHLGRSKPEIIEFLKIHTGKQKR